MASTAHSPPQQFDNTLYNQALKSLARFALPNLPGTVKFCTVTNHQGQPHQGDPWSSSPKNFIRAPIEDFAQAKGIALTRCIQMVRDGFYDGQLIQGAWYVNALELDTKAADHNQQHARPRPKAMTAISRGLPDIVLFCILMTLLALLVTPILVPAYWPGSHGYPDNLNLAAYREPILWTIGGILIASIFATLARMLYDLSPLVAAAERRPRRVQSGK